MSAHSHPDFHPGRRLALLQHGGLLGKFGKTGLSLLRYREAAIVAVVDAETAGRSLREITQLPLERDIPIVATVAEALAYNPEVLAIGIAPSGGKLPEAWLGEIRKAVQAGVSIWNGLHAPLAADPEIAPHVRPGISVWDMRKEPPDLACGSGAAGTLACRRVLFVGTDMAIGKMTAALEFDRAAQRRGWRSKFVATGQTGMMIAGDGLCLDAVRVDYATGAVEAEVMRQGPHHDVLWIEGQGSMLNPASTATLPLLRGSQPTHLILVHKARLTHLQFLPHIALPALDRVVAFYEQVAAAAGALPSVRVAGVALNTWGLSEADAKEEVRQTAQLTGLPCVDVVRQGPGPLLDAVLPTF